MKKTLMVSTLVAALFATSAMAEGNYGGVKVEFRNGLKGDQDSTAYSLTLGQKFNQYLSGELYTRVKSNDNDTNNTRIEGALVGNLPLANGFSVYTRGAVGEKLDGTDNFAYWSIEPGVKYAVTQDLSIKGGFRCRDAFNDSDADTTRTWKLGAEYAVTKTQVVSASIDLSRGDSNYNSVGLGYNVKF